GVARPWPDVVAAEVEDGAALADLLGDPAWADSNGAADGFWHLWTALPQFGLLVADTSRREERAAWSSLSQVLSRLSERDPSATLADFMRQSDEETFEAQPLLDFRDPGADRLTVTTLHQSKGLEFEVVFIADAVEGVFPDLRPRESLIGTRHLAAHLPTDPAEYRQFRLQEETRLAYTAMTRARQRVVWTATAGGQEEGAGGYSPLLAKLSDGEPGPPKSVARLPVTTAQAEAWLRRIAADPAERPPRRLAAISCLARGPEWKLRPPDSFAGVQAPGPDTGLAPDTLRLSPSQAESYEACPRRYAIERRLRVREDRSVYLSFGSLVHNVLEATELAAMERGAAHGTIEDALAHLDAQWDPAPFGNEPFATAWRRRAERALTFTYEHWPHPDAHPVALEHALSLEIDGVPWRGRADRIEAEGDYLRIVDYKTSSSRPNGKTVAESLQLGFYMLAAAEDEALTGHGSPAEAELWMVAQRNVRSFPVVEFDPTTLDGVRERLGAVADGVGGEQWEPRPNDGCDRCAVQFICPAWPQGTRAYES
ncbi:MAG: PD-(D/E)XK nuclease family protein, partial [Acidimicrobiia bacterium]|nr:PD-(D/E)XK nuclease family protein [Acidimicrobiia bacterium]